MNVIITGATKGMGLAIANQFAAAGHRIIACARSGEELEKMRENFAARFQNEIMVRVVDVSQREAVIEFGNWILSEGINPDILVNNAGYFIPGTIHEEAEGVIEKMMEVNVYSAYHLSRTLIPKMIVNKKGHIFNICSIAAFQSLPNVGSYGISKFALLGLTKHLREEMKSFGIKVTAVSPGATYTQSWEGSNVERSRIMEADDVAKMVFACSQLSTGAVVEDIILRPQLGDL